VKSAVLIKTTPEPSRAGCYFQIQALMPAYDDLEMLCATIPFFGDVKTTSLGNRLNQNVLQEYGITQINLGHVPLIIALKPN
jgi:hypothetical protein